MPFCSEAALSTNSFRLFPLEIPQPFPVQSTQLTRPTSRDTHCALFFQASRLQMFLKCASGPLPASGTTLLLSPTYCPSRNRMCTQAHGVLTDLPIRVGALWGPHTTISPLPAQTQPSKYSGTIRKAPRAQRPPLPTPLPTQLTRAQIKGSRGRRQR